MSEYSLSKVNRVFASLWGRIEEKRDSRKVPKYKSWSSQVEKKAGSIASQLKSLEAMGHDKKEKYANITYKLTSQADDINSLLLITVFKYDANNSSNGSNTSNTNNNGASSYSQDSIRVVMLDLWTAILTSLGRVEGDVLTTLYETILGLMRRPEFEVHQLTGAAADIALRYRDILYATLDAITPRTNESLGPGLSFASRVLAVLHWRLPQVGATTITCLSRDMSNADPDIWNEITSPYKEEDHPPLQSPTLIAWPSFHKSLPTDVSLQNFVWADNLAKRELAYVGFFKEWILYVKQVLKPMPGFDWYTVPGFHTLVSTLLYDIRTKEQPPAPMSRPYPLLELQYILLEETRGELINAFVKALFLRTSAYDVLVVLNTLSLIEGWFGELQRKCALPETFDMEFFCRGIGILLDSDHHQIVLRVLQIVYNSADLFNGTFRYMLFGELLIKKMFFNLFLHWDPGVRNAFQQVLIFKMVRIKRSELYLDGYVVRELSKIQPKKAPPPENTSSSPLATITRTLSQLAPFPLSDIAETVLPQSSSPPSSPLSRASPEKTQMSVDAHLFLLLNEYLAQVEEQVRTNNPQNYPEGLQVYVPAALAGFNQHLARYHQWELKNEEEVPRLAPLPFVRLEGSG